ncbi:MATE family efflux transporter [Candidatus Woesearchaeota archaeon]|nr:MATE family efflux transporter [Candidatus Woesearchaeota archaeon]
MRDTTDGSIMKNILHLSWPTMIAMLLHVGFNIVDAIFVGRIGPKAIAAVSIVFPVVFLMFSLGVGIGIGAASLIARYIGAKKVKEANNAAEHSFIIAIAVSVLFTIFGLLFAKEMFMLIGAKPDVVDLAVKYSRWIFGFNIFMFLGMISNNVLRGLGNMKLPMIGMVTGTLLNIILDPLLIFGIGFFPALGVEGAAIATVVSRFSSAVLMLGFIFSSKTAISIKPRDFIFKPIFIKEILRVGIPASLYRSIMSFTMLAFTKIVSYFGSVAIAAYGVGFRIQSVVVLPVIAIATAVITIVGQNVGAKNFKRAEKTVWISVKISAFFVFLISLILFSFPKLIYGVFTNDPQLIRYGIGFLRIMSFSYIFMTVSIIIGGAFQGAGHAMPTLVVNMIRSFIFGIPLALFFAFILGWGLNGVWVGIALAAIISSFISIFWFKKGSWKR